MVLIKKLSNEQSETDYLLSYLELVASKINKPSCFFHASVDKSGKIPQLYIREK